MKYIIIGVLMIFLIVPTWVAVDMSWDFTDFFSKWIDAIKEFVPPMVLGVAFIVALYLIIFGLCNLF